MEQKKRRLPPLKSLVFLEAVARTGSVTAAADELSITHSAVSKQLSQLEAWFGVPLFVEKRRGMIPTAAIAHAASVIGRALDDIQYALEEIKPASISMPKLNVIAPATFAMRWLIPRLPMFHSADRCADVTVRATHTPEAWLDLDFDVAIRRGGTVPDQFAPRQLFSERLILVASNRFESLRGNDPKDFIAQVGLLDVATRPGELDAMLNAIHVPRAAAKKALKMPHFYIGLDAMLNGQGALVVPSFLMEAYIERGDVFEVQPDAAVPGLPYLIFANPKTPRASAAAEFIEWVATCPPRANPRTAVAEGLTYQALDL